MQAASTRTRTGAAVVAAGLLAAALGVAAQTPARTGPPPPPPAAREPPRLVVLLVIDQFRGDYPDLYGQQWTHGLRRLFTSGAVFPLAEFPYADTVTCPGHASIGTGRLPSLHGMIGNEWYDQVLKRTVLCSYDQTATSVAFGGATGTEHHSLHNLLVPAFADELRLQAPHPSQIVSVALKPRAAMSLGGHGGPGATVIWEEDRGVWATSDAYTKTPWPDVDAFVAAHPIAAAYGQTWTKLLPAPAYRFDDDAPGEASPAPWGRVFPHKLESRSGTPDNAFVSTWERSPFSDAYVADLAMHLVETRRLGGRAGSTDMLAASFAALDLVGHEYGPRSHEVQDVMARLDMALGKLFDALDRSVGAGRYVVALGSDHGVAPLPEQSTAIGLDAGRIASAELRRTVQTTTAQLLGEGTFYAAFVDPLVYLTPGTADKLRAKPGAIDAMKSALGAVKGIARVYGPDELGGSTPTDDRFLQAWRRSYLPGRSGDFAVLPKPYWMVWGPGTTHGSPYGYDTRVPVVFMGAGIKAGRYLTPASPLDIAPTLAWLTHVTLSRTDGHLLVEALRQP
jgi:predicted AlkP superfamily pyrophosphatase or phosphodiesterase